MKFRIGQVTYDLGALDLLSLKDILLMEKETTELGKTLRWSEVQRMAKEVDALDTDEQRRDHPDAVWVTAITIWASRRIAGEEQPFGDAIDFPMRDLTWIPEPQDRKKPEHPTKARPVSGRARKRPAAAAAKTPSRLTSPRASTPG
jgi:hypothetical protein